VQTGSVFLLCSSVLKTYPVSVWLDTTATLRLLYFTYLLVVNCAPGTTSAIYDCCGNCAGSSTRSGRVYSLHSMPRGVATCSSKLTLGRTCYHCYTSERVIIIWNSLDNRTITSESLNIFKGNLERLRSSKAMGPFIGN